MQSANTQDEFDESSTSESSTDDVSDELNVDKIEALTPKKLSKNICKFATTKDVYGLNGIVKSNQCLNVFCGEETPIFLLAKKNEETSVAFLFNKYRACINYAVEGAAEGDHKNLMEGLIKKGNASKNFAVRGAARGKRKKLMDALLKERASVDYAIEGAAAANDKKTVEHLLTLGADINNAVFGAALSGNTDLVLDLIQRGADIDFALMGSTIGDHPSLAKKLEKKGANIKYAMLGATMGNHEALTRTYIEKAQQKLVNQGDTIEEDKDLSLYHLLGAAKAGNSQTVLHNLKYLSQLVKYDNNKDKILKSILNKAVFVAAYAGHLDLAKLLIERGANPFYAFTGAVAGEHDELIKCLHGPAMKTKQYDQLSQSDLEKDLENFSPFEKESKLEYLITKKKNNFKRAAILLKTLNQTGVELSNTSQSTDEKNKIFLAAQNRTNKIMELMTKENLNYDEAQKYLAAKANNWFFQGQHLIKEGSPFEIYIHITTFVLGSDTQSAIKILNVAQKRVKSHVHTTELGFFANTDSNNNNNNNTTQSNVKKKRLAFLSKK